MQQPQTYTDNHGVERCRVIKQAAVPNVPNDPAKGYRQADVYCNQPLTLSVSEKRKICPSCYKEPVVGNPTPRTTNANGVVLSVKEMEECGLNPDGTRIDGKAVTRIISTQTIEAPKAVEAKVEVKKDAVVVEIPLAELEANADVAAYLIRKVVAGFGALPITNYAESKRMMKLEEKLEKMLEA